MSDLDEKEQKHVRTALRYLRSRVGTWAPVAEALHFQTKTVERAARGCNPVTATMAFRVARLVGVMVDDLLVGKFLPPGACPHCGHVITSDFKDESTVVEDAARPSIANGLRLVP